jgi:hypothetical protein
MAYKFVYFVKAYLIPPTLVVNNYQIRVHLVPNNGARTWEPKGTKHVQVLNLENKKQVTTVVSFNVVGDLLPPHVMFTSSTPKTLPP